MNLTVFCDGGARGNPGPAAISFVVKNQLSNTIFETGQPIGLATNNVAEYKAVISALVWLKDYVVNQKVNSIYFFLDSLLVVNQLNGLFKIKDNHLKELVLKIRGLENNISSEIHYQHVVREKNQRADFLVNQALDRNKPFE